MKICVGEEYINVTFGQIKKLEWYPTNGDVNIITVGDAIRDNSGRKIQNILCTSDDTTDSFIAVDTNGRVISQYIGGEFLIYYFGV